MDTVRFIYRLGFENEHLERIPLGALDEAVFFDPEHFLRIYDDSSSELEEFRSYIHMWVDLNELRSIGYHFCEGATGSEIERFEQLCKTRDFVDSVTERWGAFKISPPGPLDDPGAEMTIHVDGTDMSYASMVRKFLPEEHITYRELFDDYRYLRTAFFNAQN